MAGRRQKGIPGLYGGDARGLYGSSSYGRRGTMIYGKQPTPRWPVFIAAILIVVIIVLCVRQFACGGIFPEDQQSQQQESAVTQEESSDVQEVVEKTPVSGSFTLTAVGDCTLGTDTDFETDTNFDTVFKNNNAAYFFSRVTKFTANDDLTIANLEGPLTDTTTPTDKGEGSYNFRGPTSYTSILKKGSVEACNLANNHAYDYGDNGYDDTKAALEKANIGFFNADLTYTTEINGIKVGLYGINATAGYDSATDTMEDAVESLQDEGCDVVIGVFHWGIEGQNEVETDQVTLAHAAIDAGTNLVLGGHPHVLQGVEKYKDCYIVYSLGNFVFGGNDNPGSYSTMMYQQTFTIEEGQLNVDSTLSSAQIIPCRLSTSTTINNYEPIPLGGKEGVDIVKSVNKYSKALSGTGVTFNTKIDDNDIATVEQG